MSKPVNAPICKGLDGRRRVIRSGRKSYSINISTERVIRRSYHKRRHWLFSKKVTVEETLVYEMACDFPRTDSDFFGNGEYYAEEETTGAWWEFENDKSAEEFIREEF